MQSGPEREHLERLRRRDQEAIASEFRAQHRWLVASARRMGFGASDAEELALAVWATFIEIVPRFEGRSAVRTFLLGVLRRKASEARRKRDLTAPVECADLAAGPEAQLENQLETQRLGRAVSACAEQLSPAERRVVELRAIEGEGGPDVARRLSLTANHVAVLLHRARRHLLDCLGAELRELLRAL
jgi:RNA polymerase sigma-70 factor (ECF subfamily)